jgi:hypothetical protein
VQVLAQQLGQPRLRPRGGRPHRLALVPGHAGDLGHEGGAVGQRDLARVRRRRRDSAVLRPARRAAGRAAPQVLAEVRPVPAVGDPQLVQHGDARTAQRLSGPQHRGRDTGRLAVPDHGRAVDVVARDEPGQVLRLGPGVVGVPVGGRQVVARGEQHPAPADRDDGQAVGGMEAEQVRHGGDELGGRTELERALGCHAGSVAGTGGPADATSAACGRHAGYPQGRNTE